MGTTSSNVNRKRQTKKFYLNIRGSPVKSNCQVFSNRIAQLQCDPRSPTDGISRTPIQVDDSQWPIAQVKLYNHVIPNIIGPDILINGIEIDGENERNEVNRREDHAVLFENEMKRSSGIEPTLDPSQVLPKLVANNTGQLPPYQL